MSRQGARLTAALLVLAALAAAGAARAERQLVEGVAAVVGDQIILESEVDEELYLYQARSGVRLEPEEAQQARDRILQEMVDEMLLVAKARRDSIALEPGELDAEIGRRIDDLRARQGSDEAFQAALAREGLTEADLRRIYRDDVERRLLGQKVVDRDVRPRADVTWAEVGAYYEEHTAEVAAVPERYEVGGVLIRPTVSEGAKRAAHARIEEIRGRLAQGELFENLAREYSDDPSAADGGDLGTFERGTMVPEFEDAAFALNEGETSGIVTTRFGFHLIQAVEKGEDSMHARHILLRLAPGPEDDSRAAALAESVRQRAAAGEDFAALASRYSADTRSAQQGGVLGWFAREELVPEFLSAIEALAPGEVGAVLPGDGGYYVLKVLAHEDARTASLDEVRSRLRDFLVERRTEEEYQRLIDRLSGEIYVDVRSQAAPAP